MKIRNAAKLLLIAFLSTPGVSFAEEIKKENPSDPCLIVSGVAEQIMTSRQNGIAMSKMMELAGQMKADDEAARLAGVEMLRGFVIKAYDMDRHFSDSLKQREIEDFRDQAYLACVKGQAKASK